LPKRVAIIQSCYIPWKGYFDFIKGVDEFFLLDCVQYTRRDWRNRNRIKTPQGPRWLSIPVEVSGKYDQTIRETRLADKSWARKHWSALKHNYAKAAYFPEYEARFEELYLGSRETSLSEVNFRFLSAVCELLGIRTRLTWAETFQGTLGKTERLVSLCRQVGATEYVSGPSARDYLEESLFREAGIGLSFVDYDGYPEYRQLFPPFEHRVSVLDLIFNEGPDAPRYLKTFQPRENFADAQKRDRDFRGRHHGPAGPLLFR
jgi:hypothetical protein